MSENTNQNYNQDHNNKGNNGHNNQKVTVKTPVAKFIEQYMLIDMVIAKLWPIIIPLVAYISYQVGSATSPTETMTNSNKVNVNVNTERKETVFTLKVYKEGEKPVITLKNRDRSKMDSLFAKYNAEYDVRKVIVLENKDIYLEAEKEVE